MNFLSYLIINIFGILTRGFPLPCKTGLIKIGTPDENSPVFLTVNYRITMERVRRVLEKEGIDSYLLVANSKGINVWCSATGGHFTNHSVISVLKTSGIEKLVKHKAVILPQLAAAGVETQVVQKKTGWHIKWGPVYARDIGRYIRNNLEKTREMRVVRFPLFHRIEMALMWAFPFSLMTALIAYIFWRKALLPLVLLTWIIPLLIFIFFPLFSGFLNPGKKEPGLSKYTVVFEFTRFPLILGAIFILCLTLYGIATGTLSPDFIIRWGIASLIIVLLVSIDLMGSTPVYKSGLHEERLLKVVLDADKCNGCGICEQVCPRNCYDMDAENHLAVITRGGKCVQCSACIVQCPLDALYFRSPEDEILTPDIIRKFKLNLMGSRLVKEG